MMKYTQQIEAEVKRILDTETSAIVLSNKLFAPGGLFAKLAATEAERRALACTQLFRAAQQRLSALQRQEGRSLSEAANHLGHAQKGAKTVLKLESTT